MKEVEKNVILLTLIVLVGFFVTLILTSAQIATFFGPNAGGTNLSLTNGTNWSTSVILNVTFVNGTDITIANNASNLASINATFWYNTTEGNGLTSNWTLLGNSTTCASTSGTAGNGVVYACWVNLSITSLTDGLYNITAILSNSSGRTLNVTNGTVISLVRFDSTVPRVAAANISSNTVTGGNYSSNAKGLLILNVSVFDVGVGVQAVFFNITNASGYQNATIFASNPNGNVWNATFNTTSVPDGLYNITVFANDSVGNLNSTAAVTTIRFDSAIPVVAAANISSPIKGGNYSALQDIAGQGIAGLLILNVTVTDTGSGVSQVFFNITNASGYQNATIFASNPTGNIWNSTLNTTQFPDGTYNITIFANDSAGNLNSTAMVSPLIFDNTKPVLTFSCLPYTVNQNALVSCSCSATDAVSGVNSSTLSFTGNPSTATVGSFSSSCKASDYSGNNQTGSFAYTVLSTAIVGSSGSSGGGSSSSSAITPTITTGNTNTITESQLSQGYEAKFSANSAVTVSFTTSSQSIETHKIQITSISSNQATVVISSDPITLDLLVGDSKDVDVNGDGISDINVILNSITAGKADIKITQIKSQVSASPNETTPISAPSANTQTPQSRKIITYVFVIIIALVILILIAYLVLRKGKRKSRF